MVLIYGNEPRTNAKFSKPISEWEPAQVMGAWQKHVENRCFLFFMYTKGTCSERQQASQELEICDRKIAFWERHPNFDKPAAQLANAKIKRNWQAPTKK